MTPLSGLDATIEMHPHPRGERKFKKPCFCGTSHTWGERGTRTFIIPVDRFKGEGWQMIQCACGAWHMKPITRQYAENLINEEKA
jgi:hypothetical protein